MWIVAREIGLEFKLEREITRIKESNSEMEMERWNLLIAPVELSKNLSICCYDYKFNSNLDLELVRILED